MRTRRWKGGSGYQVTASPMEFVERLPLPGEFVDLGEMGRVKVMSAYDASDPGCLRPEDRLWRLTVQTGDVGPEWDEMPA